MSSPTKDPALADHLAWLGYVQPEGLVVSAPALVDAQVIIDRAQLADLQRQFADHVSDLPIAEGDTAETQPGIENLQRLVTELLGWQYELLVGLDPSRPLPESLYIALPEFQETLRPSFAVKNPRAKDPASPWLMLVKSHPATVDLDKPGASSERGWHASPSKKFERLLRETGVPIGLITNGVQLRLIYAPPKENSGALTFPVGAMAEVSGRLILGAFKLLLGSWTLFTAPSEARLPALLQRSRDYQASVSEILAEQVLHALYELLRGFEAAEERAQGKLLCELAAKNPADIYGGLVTVLLRLVFILFAEDRGLLPGSGLYVRHYAVRGLFERLRADAERYPDTMDHRFGAWAQLLALFRVIHGGCRHPDLKMPARAGHLFDPARYPFLEGRASAPDPIGALPLVSDGTIHRILEKLCILEGERVSYRTLDVEEIGSVYQTIMGFGVETAVGTAIALKGKRKNGGVPAAPIITLEQILAVSAKDRAKWLKENADTELIGEADKKLKAAATVDDLLVALEKRIDRHATPAPVAKGGLVLQPGDERRRSGSHYTPRSFTEPIVRKTLEPILKNLGAAEHRSPTSDGVPTPDAILSLKICDIAIGSGAFQVETCRQLGDALIKAWRVHGGRPALPPDETEELLAMRLIAQHCLYGVDRNPMAVDLAKLSLWLATLAKDHPFTFLDHAIRCGDSLVGLTRRQIEVFSWKPVATIESQKLKMTTGLLWEQEVRKRTKDALRERQNLLGLGDDYGSPQLKREKLAKADELLDYVRFIGNAAICAFFSADKDKAREAKRQEFIERLTDPDFRKRPIAEVKAMRGGRFPVIPFHWEIEFPEVFDRENPGFDGIVGNPPYGGKNTIAGGNREGYLDWLKNLHKESHGNADLVAHFFRHAFNLLRPNGCFGLIATKTIRQGDTRATGLRWICVNGGTIYAAQRRYKWPGQAAVVVSVVWVTRRSPSGPFDLDGNLVPIITAYLFHSGGHENAARIQANTNKSFIGNFVLGIGFTFDDGDKTGQANSIADMERLVNQNAQNRERIFPYLNGEEVNSSPAPVPTRYIINFGGMAEADAQKWPDLYAIVRDKVRPNRLRQGSIVNPDRWWMYARSAADLYRAVSGFRRVIARSLTSTNFSTFTHLPTGYVYDQTLVVFAFENSAALGILASRAHEAWALFQGGSMKDDPRYNVADCFDTFPFPAGFETNAALEAAGREYYEFRAALMQDLWLGLTEIYNLFHSPDDEALSRLEALFRKRAANSDWRTAEGVPTDRLPLKLYASPAAALTGVQRLRILHAAMDAAVLTAYGWTDLLPKCTCEFLLDYEDEEDSQTVGQGGREDHETVGQGDYETLQSPSLTVPRSPSPSAPKSPSRRKKPWRYRWPDEVRDEVLARLLKLNAERAEEERLAGLSAAASGEGKTKAKRGRKKMQPLPGQGDLIPPPQMDLFGG